MSERGATRVIPMSEETVVQILLEACRIEKILECALSGSAAMCQGVLRAGLVHVGNIKEACSREANAKRPRRARVLHAGY